MGRWSRRLALQFLSWLRPPAGSHWLDVGCGSGALTDAICSNAAPASVLGCDPAEPFIEYARGMTADPRVQFAVAACGSLPVRQGGYGVTASLLALNFVPDPAAAVREMRALTTAAGTVSACVWDYADGMALLRHFWDAAVALDPAARDLDEGIRFPLCRPAALSDLFRNAGLDDVGCEPIEIATDFASFDDYWRPFLGGTGPAPSYVASLDDDRKHRLRDELRQRLAPSVSDPLRLTASAWAVRGTVRS